MGIRFRCHRCNEPLHVKFFQAGKKGRCPHCQSRFRIPNEDSELSIPLESAPREPGKAMLHIDDQEPVPVSDKGGAVAILEDGPPTQKPVHSSSTPADNDEARWFVRPPSGGVYGPADTSTLASWIAQRRVTADSYIWRDGMEVWRIAIELMPDAFVGNSGSAEHALAPPPVNLPESPVPAPYEMPETQSRLKPELAKAKANLDQRRQRRKKQTWIILGLLMVIALGLLTTLFVVLSG